MSENALRFMPKIGLGESCEKKVCLDVLHIELVIMYKLFLSPRVYIDFILKFFVTCCCEVVTVCVLHLSYGAVNEPLCCDVVMCSTHASMAGVSCVCVCVCCVTHVCVCWRSYCIKTFFTDVDVVDAWYQSAHH
jgi:hypothetical protein